MSRPPAVIVDVDGTLALRGSRMPFDWSQVQFDRPNVPAVRVVRSLAEGSAVIYVSGREDTCKDATECWLDQNVGVAGPLHMRAKGDNRKDSELKSTIFAELISPQFEVWLVLDDRDQTVAMWRSLGLTCFQVAEGNF